MQDHRALTQFFARRTSVPTDRHLSSIDFGLIDHITRQRGFSSVDSLVTFCRNPRNLSGFLPDPRDRTVFSKRLVNALIEYRSAGTC